MMKSILKVSLFSIISAMVVFGANFSEQAEATDKIEFLAFGDSGYHYTYQKAKLYKNPLTTKEAYLTAFQKNWPKRITRLI